MKKLGVLTTSLLLTASLLFYSGRSNPETSREQVQPQQWVVKTIPFKEQSRRFLRPLLIRVKSLIPLL